MTIYEMGERNIEEFRKSAEYQAWSEDDRRRYDQTANVVLLAVAEPMRMPLRWPAPLFPSL